MEFRSLAVMTPARPKRGNFGLEAGRKARRPARIECSADLGGPPEPRAGRKCGGSAPPAQLGRGRAWLSGAMTPRTVCPGAMTPRTVCPGAGIARAGWSGNGYGIHQMSELCPEAGRV